MSLCVREGEGEKEGGREGEGDRETEGGREGGGERQSKSKFAYQQVTHHHVHLPNRSIKPDIEHLVLISLQRNWGTPLQISCDAARLQSISHPR